MNEILKWVNSYSAAIQALASVFLLIVTIMYVVATFRLIHLPNTTFLRPIFVSVDRNNWFIKLKNFGPGLAINIKLQAVVLERFILLDTKSQMGISEIKYRSANGIYQIEQGTESDYYFEDPIDFKFPILISWESSTGKKFKKLWLITIGFNDEFIRLAFPKSIRYKLKWFLINLKSPYYKLIRKIKYKDNQSENNIKFLILDYLNEHGKNSYDYITDEIGKTIKINDKITIGMLQLMAKKKYILYYGDEAIITDKGKREIAKIKKKRKFNENLEK